MKIYKLIEKRNIWFSLSGAVIILGFLLMALKGIASKPVLNFGIDFKGGSTLILKFDQDVTAKNSDAFIKSL